MLHKEGDTSREDATSQEDATPQKDAVSRKDVTSRKDATSRQDPTSLKDATFWQDPTSRQALPECGYDPLPMSVSRYKNYLQGLVGAYMYVPVARLDK